jgi:hypothetical protein
MKKLSARQKYLKPVHKSAEILECGDWSPLFVLRRYLIGMAGFWPGAKSGDWSPHSRKHHLLWWQTSRFNLHRLQVSESKSI